MSNRKAVFGISISTIAVVIIVALYVFGLMYKPAYGSSIGPQKDVSVRNLPNGHHAVTLHLNIVQTVNIGPHPDWLGYQSLDGKTPGTIFSVPANSTVTMIVHNYDSQTALRNTFFTLVQGTIDGTEIANGKKISVMDPNLTSHTFTINDLGVSVPMQGISATAAAGSYVTMKFTFRVGSKGHYRWQCIVPCGSGSYGFGGPMQEFGYMDGFVNVV
ncbi:MAG: hypothetical protein ACRDFX_01205 [Chloroflexota bacterium]